MRQGGTLGGEPGHGVVEAREELTTGTTGNGTEDYAGDLFAQPEIDLTRDDKAVTIDGTKATDFAPQLPDEKRPLERSNLSCQTVRFTEKRALHVVTGFAGLVTWSGKHHGAIPADKHATGELWTSFFYAESEPLIRATLTSPETKTLTARTSSYLKRFEGTRKYDVVDAGSGSAADLAATDVRGKAALVRLDRIGGTAGPTLRAVEAAGAAAIVVAPNDDSPQSFVIRGVNVPYFATTYREGRDLAATVAKSPRTSITLRGGERVPLHLRGRAVAHRVRRLQRRHAGDDPGLPSGSGQRERLVGTGDAQRQGHRLRVQLLPHGRRHGLPAARRRRRPERPLSPGRPRTDLDVLPRR
ncbi:PA domain-containing protein [Streptomyces sp. NPDC006482]|uniref:PA domain-containing protein n=1 Tax=Streptomyces sp. NPDC006482 TaxID=3154306 RepID=UPI0033A3AD3A